MVINGDFSQKITHLLDPHHAVDKAIIRASQLLCGESEE